MMDGSSTELVELEGEELNFLLVSPIDNNVEGLFNKLMLI